MKLRFRWRKKMNTLSWNFQQSRDVPMICDCYLAIHQLKPLMINSPCTNSNRFHPYPCGPLFSPFYNPLILCLFIPYWEPVLLCPYDTFFFVKEKSQTLSPHLCIFLCLFITYLYFLIYTPMTFRTTEISLTCLWPLVPCINDSNTYGISLYSES